MRRVTWLVLIGAACVGCTKKTPATVATPPEAREPNASPPPKQPAKSMLALDYAGCWKKRAPKTAEPARLAKPIHDATAGQEGKRVIVIAPDGTEDEIGAAWTAFCESLSDVLVEGGAWAASREVVEGEYPLQRVRYNAPQRTGTVTIGLVRPGTETKQLAELFPAANEAARKAINNEQPGRVLLVVTVEEK